MKNLIILLVLACGINVSGQVAINIDGSAPDNSAMLDVKSTSKGMLVPRMTIAELNAISNPATGLLVFCTDNNQYYSNKGTPAAPNWAMISSQWLSNGSNIYYTGGNVGLGLSSPGYPIDVAGDINFSGTLRKNGIPVVTGVSGVTASLPLVSSGGVNPNISIPQANSLTNGFLSMGDWSLFNNKQNALAFGNLTSGDITLTGGNGAVIGVGTIMTINKGNLTEAISSVLTITGGSGAVLGNGLSLQVKQANTGQSGFLNSTDWNSFNNKVSSQWTTNGSNIYYNTGKVGIGTANPAASAALEVNSATTGFLPPRMTTAQMNAISTPTEGLTVYNNTLKTLCWYDGTTWTHAQDGKSCGTISYEGKTYETVVIGFQCWMKQNLNIGTRIDGIADQMNNSVIEKYCYNNTEANCDVYGGLYQWDEMMNWTTSSNNNPSGRQGICPNGWHIPSDAEWCQLETFIDPTINCTSTGMRGLDGGGKLKEAGFSHWSNPNIGATNAYGFTGLPAGYRYLGAFYGSLTGNYFWSSTEYDNNNSWDRGLGYETAQLYRSGVNDTKTNGFTVRCLKD